MRALTSQLCLRICNPRVIRVRYLIPIMPGAGGERTMTSKRFLSILGFVYGKLPLMDQLMRWKVAMTDTVLVGAHWEMARAG